MASAAYGSVPFTEQIEFFRRKLNIPTQAWTDIYNTEHDWAFMVAGASRNALVEDFREAIEKAILQGTTLEEFRKDFDNIVAHHGWDYNGGRDWRSRTIYETNLYSSYNAGRYEQLSASKKELPYWRYVHSDTVLQPRELHLAWDGLILSADDPWWHTHFPINAWGCHCSVEALSDFDLREMGKSGPDNAPDIHWVDKEIGKRSPDGPRIVSVPEGIDPGFEYVPGRSRIKNKIPPESNGSPLISGIPNRYPDDPLPRPRNLSNSALLAGRLSDDLYIKTFLDTLGADSNEPTVIRDVIGEPLSVGRELFQDRMTGELTVNRNGRGQLVKLLAHTILDPDEIWVRIEWHEAQKKAIVRRRYFAQYNVEKTPGVFMFDYSDSGWSGLTMFPQNSFSTETLRAGVRLYQREG